MVYVKICGVTRVEDLEAAVEAGADALGFVFDVPWSPRNLSLHKAQTLVNMVPWGVESVAVTVFKSVEQISMVMNELDVDLIQVHGDLHPVLGGLRKLSSTDRLIGAVNALSPDAKPLALEYSKIFHRVLLDSAGEGGLGGTGKAHDWSQSRKIRDAIHPKDLVLAGGLNEENVGEAIREVQPYGVDVSSGVESLPGMKDHDKIKKFMLKVEEASP